MIKNIFFDFFGVLIDESESKFGEIDFRSKYFSLPFDEIKNDVLPYRNIMLNGNMKISTFWDKISKSLGIKIRKDQEERLFVEAMKNNEFHTKVYEFIKILKQNGYFCYVLSDVFVPSKKYIQNQGRYSEFNGLILSCDIGLSKIEDVNNNTHKIFDYAITKYDLDPKTCLFIDDRQENCDIAIKAGFNVICENQPEKIIEKIKNIIGEKDILKN